MTQNPDFRSLKLSVPLLDVIQELGYQSMTPIQAESIPLLLKGKDLIGQSRTGSGKTAAYTIPILERVGLKRRYIQALILCPTRELCAQVAREARKLGRRHAGLQVLVVAGGQPLRPQVNALDKGVHLIVGTPGRIVDHLKRNTIDLSQIRTLVLDEADLMLDMGFEADMETILNSCPKDRQTVLFSATFPPSIEELSRDYQNKPSRVTIEEEDAAAANIEQLLYEIEPTNKQVALVQLMEALRPESAIVFCNHKITTTNIASDLNNIGMSAAALQGDLEQFDRDKVMAKFRNKSIRVLVATDVAARGIDVENVDVVINFDLPIKPEIYVHRIGRTGRAGKTGVAIALVSQRERHKISLIEELTGTTIERRHLEKSAPKKIDGAAKPERPSHGALMVTLRIAAGRKDKLRPGDILGALTGEAGQLDGASVGKIEIHDRFSYVAVAAGVAKTALERLRNGRIKGRRLDVDIVD